MNPALFERLSPRVREVMQACLTGERLYQIAKRLGISPSCVRQYRQKALIIWRHPSCRKFRTPKLIALTESPKPWHEALADFNSFASE